MLVIVIQFEYLRICIFNKTAFEFPFYTVLLCDERKGGGARPAGRYIDIKRIMEMRLVVRAVKCFLLIVRPLIQNLNMRRNVNI